MRHRQATGPARGRESRGGGGLAAAGALGVRARAGPAPAGGAAAQRGAEREQHARLVDDHLAAEVAVDRADQLVLGGRGLNVALGLERGVGVGVGGVVLVRVEGGGAGEKPGPAASKAGRSDRGGPHQLVDAAVAAERGRLQLEQVDGLRE